MARNYRYIIDAIPLMPGRKDIGPQKSSFTAEDDASACAETRKIRATVCGRPGTTALHFEILEECEGGSENGTHRESIPTRTVFVHHDLPCNDTACVANMTGRVVKEDVEKSEAI